MSEQTVETYLFFNGQCDEALEFYKRTLGAEVTSVMRFKDSPEPLPPDMPAGSESKVMHASFRVGGTVIMASDGHCHGRANFEGFALTLTVPAEAEADRFFAALAKDGKIQTPLTKTFFSPKFGMVTDRFGVLWMVMVYPPECEKE